ncbi:MAG: hypothetical protein U0529_22030 [Thermoanaerobaculia bacterium]
MDGTPTTKPRSGDEVDRRIRIEWAARQVRKGFMDLQEAALAARVPVTALASVVGADARGVAAGAHAA